MVIQSAIQWHLQAETSIPPPNTCNQLPSIHAHYMLPGSSVDTPVDIHGRSHSFPTPQQSVPGLMYDCQTIIFLWMILLSLPSGSRLGWGGAGTSVQTWQTPTHKGMPASDEGGASCSVGCVNDHIGPHIGDICHDLMHYLVRFVLQSILNLPLPLKGICLY